MIEIDPYSLEGQRAHIAELQRALEDERRNHANCRQQNLKLKTVLREATEFVDRHSESWYRSGQRLLAKCREVLGDR